MVVFLEKHNFKPGAKSVKIRHIQLFSSMVHVLGRRFDKKGTIVLIAVFLVFWAITIGVIGFLNQVLFRIESSFLILTLARRQEEE